MVRRLVFSNLKTLSPSSSSAILRPSFSSLAHRLPAASSVVLSSSFLLSRRHFSADAGCVEVSKAQSKVEDALSIATGHERRKLEAEPKGEDILEQEEELNYHGCATTLLDVL